MCVGKSVQFVISQWHMDALQPVNPVPSPWAAPSLSHTAPLSSDAGTTPPAALCPAAPVVVSPARAPHVAPPKTVDPPCVLWLPGPSAWPRVCWPPRLQLTLTTALLSSADLPCLLSSAVLPVTGPGGRPLPWPPGEVVPPAPGFLPSTRQSSSPCLSSCLPPLDAPWA